MTEWPQLGKETFLKTTYSNEIYLCIVLSKCTYGACKQMLNAAMKKTLPCTQRTAMYSIIEL